MNKLNNYQKGFIDGFNRCLDMIEELKLSLVYKDVINGIMNKKGE